MSENTNENINRELTDSERLEVALSLLTDKQLDEYAEECRELEQTDIYR